MYGAESKYPSCNFERKLVKSLYKFKDDMPLFKALIIKSRSLLFYGAKSDNNLFSTYLASGTIFKRPPNFRLS